MSTTYIIKKENEDSWRSAFPHMFETECSFDVGVLSWYAYVMGYADGTWGRSIYRCSTMGNPYKTNMDGGNPVFSILDEDNPRFCGYISEGNEDVSIEVDENGYITSNIQFYIHLNEHGNIKRLSNNVYGTNASKDTAPTTVDELGQYNEWQGNTGIMRCNVDISGMHADLLAIDSNIPVFDTKAHAQAYISNGSTEGLLNGRYEQNDKIPTEYYYECDVFRTDMAYNNKSQVDHIRNYYQVGRGKVKMVRYLQKKVNGYYNNVIVAKGDGQIVCSHGGNTSPTAYGVFAFNVLTSGYNREGLQGEQVYNNYIYRGVVRSNIPCADSQENAMKYMNDEITLDEMPREKQNATDVYSYKDTTSRKWTGDDANNQDTDITSNTYADGNLISQYIMTSSQLSNVGDLIYTTQTDTLNALKLALKSHGETFITDIVDVYHVPIDVSSFVSTSSVANIPFGLYESDCSGTKITVHGKIKDLGSIYITPIHNDFRDYECVEMSLYLPFCAIIPLPTDIFMNSTLSVKVGADLRSHNLRYYVFVNNEEGTSLYSYHDCAFGQSISLMGNDSGARALQCLSTGFEIMNTQRNLTFGNIDTMSSMGQGMFNQAMQGNVIGAGLSLINGANRLEQNTQNAKASIMQSKLSLNMSQAPRIYSGSQGSGLSENDILYPYVLFNVQNTNRADIRSIYGLPCNVSGKLGKFKGFTQCDDVRVNANIPSNEKQLLIDALKEGIIL